eukprot:scaffold22143_cov41-Cyclotella_meneghiniana.AAC.8
MTLLLIYLNYEAHPDMLSAVQGGQSAGNSSDKTEHHSEIVATNECMTELEHIRHRALELHTPDANIKITFYNANDACVQWSASVTNKGTKHEPQENYGPSEVEHIS